MSLNAHQQNHGRFWVTFIRTQIRECNTTKPKVNARPTMIYERPQQIMQRYLHEWPCAKESASPNLHERGMPASFDNTMKILQFFDLTWDQFFVFEPENQPSSAVSTRAFGNWLKKEALERQAEQNALTMKEWFICDKNNKSLEDGNWEETLNHFYHHTLDFVEDESSVCCFRTCVPDFRADLCETNRYSKCLERLSGTYVGSDRGQTVMPRLICCYQNQKRKNLPGTKYALSWLSAPLVTTDSGF